MTRLAAAKRREEVVGGSMTVDAWYKEPKGLTSKFLTMYDEKYKGYIKPRVGHMKLRDVRDVHPQRILNDQAGMSASHAKKLRMVMQEMFKRARQSRLIPSDPAELLELPAVTAGGHRAVTEVERAAILAVAETHRTDLQRVGVPINVAKELMGHADIQTTVTKNLTRRDMAVDRVPPDYHKGLFVDSIHRFGYAPS